MKKVIVIVVVVVDGGGGGAWWRWWFSQRITKEYKQQQTYKSHLGCLISLNYTTKVINVEYGKGNE